MKAFFHHHVVAFSIAFGAVMGLLAVAGMNTVYDEHLRETNNSPATSQGGNTSKSGSTTTQVGSHFVVTK